MENKEENNVELLIDTKPEESVETLEETKVEATTEVLEEKEERAPEVLVEEKQETNTEVVNEEKVEESTSVVEETKVEATPEVVADVKIEVNNAPITENKESNVSDETTEVKPEGEKKKNNKLIIYGVIILVLIVILVVFSLSNGSVDETAGTENSGNDVVEEGTDSTEENITEDLPNVGSLDDYTTADTLIELVKLTTYGDVDTEVYKNGGITFDRMNDHYKFTLASKLIETENNYYTEQEMKEAFTNFFGKNTYKEVSNVVIGCAPYTYDANEKKYVVNVEGCGGASAFSVNEQVLSSKEENDVYEIVTVVVYSNEDGYFKDVDSKKIISNADGFDIDAYMKTNVSSLEQYTYSFAKEDGHYIYKGVTRTNNYQ